MSTDVPEKMTYRLTEFQRQRIAKLAQQRVEKFGQAPSWQLLLSEIVEAGLAKLLGKRAD